MSTYQKSNSKYTKQRGRDSGKAPQTEEKKQETPVQEVSEEVEIINRSGKDLPGPMESFSNKLIPKFVKDVVDELGFKKPTPIQSHCIPLALAGHDLISVAKTGSGKTFGYMIPCLTRVVEQKKELTQQNNYLPRGPFGLVLAPTRELVSQIVKAVEKMTWKARLQSCAVYGGASRWGQKQKLRAGVDIVIATPGRLLDFLASGDLELKHISYLILDEADRMLDMGFLPSLKEICQYLPPKRQCMFFSATWPKAVERFSAQICSEHYVKIKVGSEDLTINPNITQHVELVDDKGKNRRLMELLKEINVGTDRVIIFMRTKRSCDRLNTQLDYQGYRSDTIHGNKMQRQRERTLESFRRGQFNILVATDVAARGLDVKGIKYVINHDFPQQIEDYVHRIGRTGRAGEKGVAYSFINKGDIPAARGLVTILSKSNQEIPDALNDLARSRSYKSFGGRRNGGGGYGGFGGRNRSRNNGRSSGYGNSGGSGGYQNRGYGGNSGGQGYRNQSYQRTPRYQG